MLTISAFIDGMGETAILYSRTLGARNVITGWPNITWASSDIKVMVKRLSVMVRDTPAGTIEEVRARLYTVSFIQMDDKILYDGLYWRVEDVQFKHLLLGNIGYYDATILRPSQLYPAPSIIPSILDVFYPVMDPDVAVGAYPVITMANNATETVYHNIKIPNDFASLISVNIIIIPGASGNMYYQGGAKWGAVCAGEIPDTHGSTLLATSTTVYNGIFTCISLTLPIATAGVDDLIGIYFTRIGGHALDTVDASCFYAGIILRYQT